MVGQEVPEPVYGPDREFAARRAIAELANAEQAYSERCFGFSDYHCEFTAGRLRVARIVRDYYPGYS